MQKNKFGRNVKIVSLVGIIIMLIPALYLLITAYERYEQNFVQVEKGIVNILDFENMVSKPAILNGEWSAYDGVYIENEEKFSEFFTDGENESYLRALPEDNLQEVSEARTYKLNIFGELNSEELNYLAVGIPLANESVRVFFNGIQIEQYSPIQSWLNGPLSVQMYLIEEAYEANRGYQELVISVPRSNMSGLYRRQISISRVNTYIQQMGTIDAVQNFLCGLMVLSVLLGFIYIAIHPSYSILTFMNLYDICKMLYILFLIGDIPMLVYNSIVPGKYGEANIRGIGLLFFFLAALFVNQLSQVTFDPDKKVHSFFLNTINILWVTGAVFYAIKPEYFTDRAIAVTMVIFLLTLVGNFLRVRVCYLDGLLDNYGKFVLIKTMVLGSVVFLDLVTLNIYPRDSALLVSLYSFFFMIHFFVRGFMYRKPYDQLERYNEELELAVKSRTMELEKANEELKNLTIKDPLTGTYNRLYFEGKLDRLLESTMNSLHLCIFDLDNFKSINDTYGHQVGDEQLLDLADAAKLVLPEDVIISRIGGEEFTLLFLNYDNQEVLLHVEMLRQELGKRAIVEGRTTGSFGITKMKNADSRKSLFVRADDCLYKAKANGKNRIEYEFE